MPDATCPCANHTTTPITTKKTKKDEDDEEEDEEEEDEEDEGDYTISREPDDQVKRERW
jgi:ribosomal protein L12E/L44/L45/RPP1/RPP2